MGDLLPNLLIILRLLWIMQVFITNKMASKYCISLQVTRIIYRHWLHALPRGSSSHRVRLGENKMQKVSECQRIYQTMILRRHNDVLLVYYKWLSRHTPNRCAFPSYVCKIRYVRTTCIKGLFFLLWLSDYLCSDLCLFRRVSDMRGSTYIKEIIGC